MEQLLVSNSFFMYQQCRCGGTRKKKFRNRDNPKLEVWLQPDIGFFTIRKDEQQVDQGQHMNLEVKLNTAIATI